jgi:ribose 5-phosphate isomerase B
MTDKPIAIASDHAGYELKSVLVKELEASGYSVLDLGTYGPASVDYPDFGVALAQVIEMGKADRGVLICGSGIGISIAANRNPAVRAALCHDETTARLAREHNDANVLALGERTTGVDVAKQCLRIFLTTDFAGGERHERRVAKLG